MRQLILLVGEPGQGKTTAARKLVEHGFASIEVDELYVSFIERRHPRLFLPELRHFIATHYNTIAMPAQRNGLSPTIARDWDQHVIEAIEAQTGDKVVCEGYLIKPPVMHHFAEVARRGGVQLQLVSAANHQLYRHALPQPISIDVLASGSA